jgi:hypothetical protein
MGVGPQFQFFTTFITFSILKRLLPSVLSDVDDVDLSPVTVTVTCHEHVPITVAFSVIASILSCLAPGLP